MHLRCSNLRGDWELWVDPETGLILKVEGEVEGGDFTIAEPFEVVTVEYDLSFASGLFDVPQLSGPSVMLPPVEGSLYFVTAERLAEPEFDYYEVKAVSYLNAATWREEVIETDGEVPRSPGSFIVSSDGQEFVYWPDSDLWGMREESTENPLRHFEWYGAECDSSGTCIIWRGDAELAGCVITSGELVIGRATTHYSCPYVDSRYEEPKSFQIDIWLDEESGLPLRHVTVEPGGESSTVFEVLEIDFEPTLDATLFEQACPTTTCRNQEEAFADPYFAVSLEQGQIAPSWSGPLIGGGVFDLADLGDRPAIFLFWYDYCCDESLFDFQELFDQWGDQVEFAVVMLSGDPANAANIRDRGGFTFPIVDDTANERDGLPEIEDTWGIGEVPIWVVLDTDRRVATVLNWESTREQREAALESVAGSGGS